jgi:hypothetical protein
MASQYDWRIGQAIVGRIWKGETVAQIAADPQMPCYATIYQWRRLHADFRGNWDAVRETMAAVRLATREAERAWAQAGQRGRPRGKPSSYTPEMAVTICAHIEAGWSMLDVVRAPGLPSSKVIYRWLRNRPEFRARYAEACTMRAMLLEDQIYDRALGSNAMSFEADQAAVARLEGRIGLVAPRLYRPGAGL